MNRRTGWMIGGSLAVVVLVGAGVWLWQSSRTTPETSSSPTPVATVQESQSPPAQQAQERLDDLLTACAESTASTPPEHCGIRIPWGTEFRSVTSIRYRVETLPTVTLDGTSFTAEGGVLVATVSGTGNDGAPRTETYRTENWAVRGDATISDGGVELSVW